MHDSQHLTTRRAVLKTGAHMVVASTALAAVPQTLLGHTLTSRDSTELRALRFGDDPTRKALTQRALDVCHSLGASYADIRLLHTRTRLFLGGDPGDQESITVGVRALVNGSWGFASGPVWSADEMVRLGREAVRQAKSNNIGPPRVVELAATPAIQDEHWTMPVTIDPFTVHPNEVRDFLGGLVRYTARRVGEERLTARSITVQCMFVDQEKTLATSEGTYCTQRLFRTSGGLNFGLEHPQTGRTYPATLDCLSPAGCGWELFRDQPLREYVDRELAAAQADMALPLKPVDVGRYTFVADASSLAQLASNTIGLATELDRALGGEANAGGTSYLNAPLEMLGRFKLGSPLLTMTADRSTPGSAATVQWDDEGVHPEPFLLVKDGVLTNFSTTREGAGWLQDYYAKTSTPIRSHGCALGGTDWFGGMYAPLSHTPNLSLTPGTASLNFDECCAQTDSGIACTRMMFDMDFQQLSGMGVGRAYELQHGKRVAVLGGTGILFQTPELWKSLIQLGGAKSAERYGMRVVKGMPPQDAYHSVTAVPAVFKDVTVIDIQRKA